MKKTQSKKKLTAPRLVGLILSAVIIVAAVSYTLSDMMREVINEEVRATLLNEGKSQRFIETSSGVVHVRESGSADGPIVLLVHGTIIGGYAYEKWQEPLAAAGYRVIVPDLLGYGYSDRPNIRYDREFYVRQLDELLNGLDINEPVNIVGASFGSAIVTAFTADNSDRVNSVTLMSPAGLGQSSFVNDFLLWPVAGDWIFRIFGGSYSRNMMTEAYSDSIGYSDLAAWMIEQTRFRGFGDGILNTLRNYAFDWQPEDYDALGKSGVPVMAVWGTEDEVTPYTQTDELLTRVPHTRLVSLDGKGHAITYGESDLTLGYIIPFLNEVNGIDVR